MGGGFVDRRVPNPLRSDLARVNAFGAAFMAVPVMPVYVPFLAARGLDIAAVLDLQAIYGLTVLGLDIPTGMLGDLIGRRRTLALGAVLSALGWIGFALAHGFGRYAAVEVVLAAGWSLVSGADVALLYDVLDRAGADRDRRRRALGNYTAAQVIGEAVASLVGGALASRSLTLVGALAAAEAALPLAAALLLPRGAIRRVGAGATLRTAPAAVRTLFDAPLPLLLFANWIVWGLATFVAVWLLQPYWRLRHVPLAANGPLWAATLLVVAGASRTAPAVVRRLGAGGAVLLLAALPVLAYAGMAFAAGPVGVASGFGLYISRGLNGVVLREAFNDRVPGALRATMNSLGSGAGRLGFAAVGPLVGIAIHRAGLPAALAGLAGAFSLAVVGLAWPLARRL